MPGPRDNDPYGPGNRRRVATAANTLDHRFRDVHRYAITRGYASGYSTLEEGIVDDTYLEYQAVMIPKEDCVHESVSTTDLETDQFGNVSRMFRHAHRYALSKGFATGFPAFEQGRGEDGILRFGTTLLKSSIVEVVSIPAKELGSPSFDNEKDVIIAAHRYAIKRDSGKYVSGFALFEQGAPNGELHYGLALVKKNAHFEQVPADVLAMFSASPEIRSVMVEDLNGVVVFNNSSHDVFVKNEHDDGVKTVKAKTWSFGRIDGVATANRSRGKIAKTPDWNVVYIGNDGSVRSFGPRKNRPFMGVDPEWHQD